MRVSRSKKSLWLCGIALLVTPLLCGAQVNDLDMRLPMNIDADNTTIDGKNSMIIFSGLRLTHQRPAVTIRVRNFCTQNI